jgi:hypothetical protein
MEKKQQLDEKSILIIKKGENGIKNGKCNRYKSKTTLNLRRHTSRIGTNLMQQEEINEKHFQNAINFNSSIPLPFTQQMNDSEYDKLYPPTYKIPKIRILIDRKLALPSFNF